MSPSGVSGPASKLSRSAGSHRSVGPFPTARTSHRTRRTRNAASTARSFLERRLRAAFPGSTRTSPSTPSKRSAPTDSPSRDDAGDPQTAPPSHGRRQRDRRVSRQRRGGARCSGPGARRGASQAVRLRRRVCAARARRAALRPHQQPCIGRIRGRLSVMR